jgi:N-acetyl-gamma-glutamyl-phosphate reductase common form
MNPTNSKPQTRPVWIVGASGLLAGELARLVAGHPGLHLAQVISRGAGTALRDLHPQLQTDLVTVDLETGVQALQEALAGCDEHSAPGLFLGLPHGQSAEMWKTISSSLGAASKQLAVVDLSADYRLRDPELHSANYGLEHPDPEGEEGFAYGLPEFWRSQIIESRRVAAPGCFATALQLAVLPAAIAGKLDATSPWILHGVTGSSGSGSAAKQGTHHPYRTGSYKAYSPSGHRHEAELVQALEEWHIEAPLHFLPHSGPWSRGIHLSCSLPLRESMSGTDAQAIYAEQYAKEAFVEVLPEGGIPELRAVVGSNRVSIGVHVRDKVLTVLLALDNTIKGGAGQGLQCMNLLLGEPESAGLSQAGLGY